MRIAVEILYMTVSFILLYQFVKLIAWYKLDDL